MDIMDLMLQTGLFTGILVLYLIVFKKYPKKKGYYSQRSWNYPLKLLCARWAVRRWKEQYAHSKQSGDEELSIRAAASDGSTLLLALRKVGPRAELSLYVRLADGTTFTLPRHPDTLVGAWQSADGGWRAGGLTVQQIDSDRLRVLYNGLLRRDGEAHEKHVVFSFIWRDASVKIRHPEDWSDHLAAQALATERWIDSRWRTLLDHSEDSSATQWGCLQGQLQAFDPEGKMQTSEWLSLRGVKVTAVKSEVEPRRAIELVLVASDGTMVQLKAACLKSLTQVRSGNVRYPNFDVESITYTDFRLVDFPESIECMPDAYVINVTTARGSLRLVSRPTRLGGRLLGGAPYTRQTHFFTTGGSIGGQPANGLLLVTTEPAESGEPCVPLTPAPVLRFTSLSETKDVSYCVTLDEPAAACEQLVGGKGASLALLTSVQKQHDYRVPPGFCLTAHALNRHLEANPAIMDAIRNIEACNRNYKEDEFKDKCNSAVKLFEATEVVADVMEEIRAHLEELITKANKQHLDPDLRFAVRSSAVGEDGEALSAAGQNATVLGCSAQDVLKAIRTCWGSMFAFTSANYRRINGQKCRCEGGVVVQAIVKARAAGVLFTRHPDNGDPTRMLLTASFGLGESVVSGAVEPDTFTIRRSEAYSPSALRLVSTQLGSKQRLVSSDGSVGEVPEEQRGTASLNEREVLRLARVALALERLWAAPRDVEWAVSEEELFLLQARPITSLQRWSERELLHEQDTPIMSDDTLVTFANVGEVMPKPISPLSQDFMMMLSTAMQYLVADGPKEYVETCGITHYRLYMDSYNSTYRNCPPKLDVNMRMTEMAVFGHFVADEHTVSVARHIHKPRRFNQLRLMLLLVKSLLFSKWHTKDSVNRTKALDVDQFESDDPKTMLTAIQVNYSKLEPVLLNHMWTSAASSASQIIAMSILLEGGQDFTPEQCNEIGVMLSSGETVSADVPLALDRLARSLAASGKAEDFRRQTPEKALYWLEDNLPEIYVEVTKFLENHGHRAFMEFDVATKPWGLEPEQLIKVLQTTPAPAHDPPKSKSDAEIIASLVTPKKSSTRKILAWILPLCRRMVANREQTKSHLILGIHKLRIAIRRLGKLMVKEWMLPDVDTVFYFRLEELQRFIETRDPVLLRKATQRRQFWPSWSQLRFAEINTGWPQPLARAVPRIEGVGAQLNATPVCAGSGDVVARAAVIKDLADIGELEQGDILITHSTDIGWSPYFPMISGIVTELGGLISHGAVIAREYGLPCVVGASGATDVFRTGDLVRLSGATGLLEKVLRTADDADEFVLV